MSNSGASSAAAEEAAIYEIVQTVIIPEWELLLFNNYVALSMFVVIVYEYFITFDLEVSEIWQKRFTGAKILFFLNRYLYLIAQVFNVLYLLVATPNGAECNAFTRIQYILNAIQSVVMYTIFTLRMFSLYHRNWLVLASLTSLNLGIFVVLVYEAVVSIGVNSSLEIGPITCTINTLMPQTISRWSLAILSLTLIIDTVVFALTIFKTYSAVRRANKLNMTQSLSYVFLRDGSLYFLVMVVLTIAALIFAKLNTESDSQSITRSNLTFQYLASTLQYILINRLVLNLSSYGKSSYSTPTATYLSTTMELPEMGFKQNTIVGNLGAPLRDGSETDWSLDSKESYKTVDYELAATLPRDAPPNA